MIFRAVRRLLEDRAPAPRPALLQDELKVAATKSCPHEFTNECYTDYTQVRLVIDVAII